MGGWFKDGRSFEEWEKWSYRTSELLSSGTSSRAHLAVERRQRQLQTNRLDSAGGGVGGGAWLAGAGPGPAGAEEATASASETCPSGPKLPKSTVKPREVSPKQSPASQRFPGVTRMAPLWVTLGDPSFGHGL